MKLTIGKVKKKETKKEDNYTDDYSDEELEAMSKEANLDPSDSYEEDDFDLEETKEIPEEVIKETEADIKKAVNDVVVFDEVGINMSYVYKFTELYPKKKIVYHNFITKQFLEWYIKNAKLPLLEKLFIIESEYINPEQQEELNKKIEKRLQKEVELEDIGTLASPKLVDVTKIFGTVIELETEEQINAYEFILTEKWDAKERAKGIQQLDAIIEEQMRIKECDLQQALNNILEKFTLVKKYYEFISNEEPDVVVIKSEPKEVEKGKRPSNAEVSKELDRSIKRFHHIKFLYELMGSDKMELVKDLSDEEIKYIKKIDELLYSTKETKQEKATKKKKTTESMDKFFGEEK